MHGTTQLRSRRKVVLLGLNGAGKTTLALALCKPFNPTAAHQQVLATGSRLLWEECLALADEPSGEKQRLPLAKQPFHVAGRIDATLLQSQQAESIDCRGAESVDGMTRRRSSVTFSETTQDGPPRSTITSSARTIVEIADTSGSPRFRQFTVDILVSSNADASIFVVDTDDLVRLPLALSELEALLTQINVPTLVALASFRDDVNRRAIEWWNRQMANMKRKPTHCLQVDLRRRSIPQSSVQRDAPGTLFDLDSGIRAVAHWCFQTVQ